MATKDVTDFDVVRAAASAREWGDASLDVLKAQTGHPEKVCFRAMERAIRRGLLDCGVSTSTAWPTDAGKALLGQRNAEPCNGLTLTARHARNAGDVI